MFYYEKNQKLRHYIAHRPDNFEYRFKSVYMFVEVLNNILSLNEDFYEYHGEESITGKNITIAYENNPHEYEFEVWKYVSKDKKFNLEFINLPDYRQMNLNIHYERVDGKIRPEISSQYNMFPPSTNQWFQILVQQPDPIVSPIYFVKVFSPQIWLAILLTILAVVIFLLAFKCIVKKIDIDLFEIILLMLGVTSSSHHNSALLCVSFKIAQLTISIFTILILTAFGTFLLTELTTRETHLPFHNLDSLIYGQHNYKTCARSKSFIFYWLVRNYNYSGHSECDSTERFCLRNHAFIYQNIVINSKMLAMLKCELIQLPQKYNIYYRTNLLKHAFRHSRQLRVSVTKMRSIGVMDYTYKLYRDYDETQFMLRNRLIEPDTTVYFEHVELIMVAYGLVIGTSLLIFFIEFVVNGMKSII